MPAFFVDGTQRVIAKLGDFNKGPFCAWHFHSAKASTPGWATF
jgi:hypothetical protein